jgi:hypothetical protein
VVVRTMLDVRGVSRKKRRLGEAECVSHVVLL